MTIQEAVGVLRPQGSSAGDLKAAYRNQCKLYHPDINPDGTELMKVINLANSILIENIGRWTVEMCADSSVGTGITEAIQEIFRKIKNLSGITAEVCGTWLWVGGNTYPCRSVLKQAGLRWAKKKTAWYWSPPESATQNRKPYSMEKIRNKYGSVGLRQETAAAISVAR